MCLENRYIAHKEVRRKPIRLDGVPVTLENFGFQYTRLELKVDPWGKFLPSP